MKKEQILEKALQKACKMIRENPPRMDNIDFNNPDFLYILYQAPSDPEGQLWFNYFISQVKEENDNAGK